jgi:FixJ family two-component response regulator
LSVPTGHDPEHPDCVVYVVDDDAAVRQALDSLLRSAGGQVQSFASAADFMAAPRPPLPACIVLDVSMPGDSGLDLQRSLNELGDRTPVIFMTAHGDIAMSVQAMKAGAADFLAKPFRDQQLLDAVALALRHDAAQLSERVQLGEWRRRIVSLSPREREVMRRVVRGMLNKKIAIELSIAEITVKVHRRHVMDKMGAQSLAELVRMVDRAESGPSA